MFARILNKFVPAVEFQLVHDIGPVRVDGAGADYQLVGDFFVGIPISDQPQDLFFTRREDRHS